MAEDGPNNPGMELKLEWLEQVDLFVCMERVCFKSSTVNFLSLSLDKSPLDQSRLLQV